MTGAAGRLGSAICRVFAEAGARVVLVGRDRASLNRAAREAGELAIVLQADLRDESEIAQAFDCVRTQVGELGVLVNSAGIAVDARLGSVTAHQFHEVYAVNVVAAYLCAQHAVGLMDRGGKIINVGSIYGTVAPDDALYEGCPGMVAASAPYQASKAALLAVTRDLAVRLAPRGIQVNMLSPGGVDADQPAAFKERYRARTPAGRMAAPRDVLGAALFLATAASDYITGQNIHVDGGFTAW